MTEPEIPPLEGDVSALLARGADVEPAPAGAKTRVLERVEAAMGPFGGGGNAAQVKSAPASAPVSSGWLRTLLPMAASFAVGSGITAAAMQRPTLVVAAPMASCPPVPAAAPPVVTAEPLRPATVPPVPAPPLPAAASQPPPVPEDQLTAERRLLDVARRALEAEEPDRALNAVAQHERRFPAGVLVQERETMAIRALLAQGRVADARTRAERFHDRFPDSLLWPTIEGALQRAVPGAASP
jgi:hypothetical protein